MVVVTVTVTLLMTGSGGGGKASVVNDAFAVLALPPSSPTDVTWYWYVVSGDSPRSVTLWEVTSVASLSVPAS